MATNNRIYYAIQQVKLGEGGKKQVVHGLQSAGITTNFNLEQVFEMGQLAIYQNVENIPEIEVTLNKVLDGYPLLYILGTEAGSAVNTSLVAQSPTISGRQNARVDVELSIYSDSKDASEGTPISVVHCNGMYVSSVSYTFPVDGNFTEDVTLVGNDKIWGGSATGSFDDAAPDDPAAAEGVNRRQHLDMTACVFPTQIPGIVKSGNDKGKNVAQSSGLGFNTHFQNITVSTDFGREAIFELGTFAPYARYVTFPVEVTSEFEVLAISGDDINATESGYYKGSYEYDGTATVADPSDTGCENPRFNLLDQRIFLQTCEGTKIWLGDKNKLTSVNYAGGDTGGGNVTVTYSYSTFNDFIVVHESTGAGIAGTTPPTPALGNSSWYTNTTATGWSGS
jgi:hypothetical protein